MTMKAQHPIRTSLLGFLAVLSALPLRSARLHHHGGARNRHLQAEDPLASFRDSLPDYTIAALEEEEQSAQSLAYEWLSNHPDLDSLPDWRKTQLFALVTIHYALDGPNWTRDAVWGPGDTKNWLNYTHPECDWDSSWYNNACNQEGQLVTLDLDYLKSSSGASNLAMPPEIGLLTSLVTVSYHVDMKMSINDLLPAQHFDLPNLERVSLLSWGGTLPSQIGNLASTLQVLSIYHNYVLDDQGARFDPYGELPTQLGLCTNLRELVLHNATFPGQLPTELGSLNQLSRLALTGTRLTGALPSQIENLVSLAQLSLQDNPTLGGTLPSSFGRDMSQLSQVNIQGNALLGGPIPSTLVGLPGLTILDVSHNQFDSTLPTEIGLATKLRRIHLGHNQLEGSLPTELSALNRLYQLDVAWNQFNQSLPSQLGLLTKLQHLNASHNSITGLPTELGLMQSISGMDVSFNALQGTLPPEVLAMGPSRGRNSWGLDLSHNQLMGALNGTAIAGLTRLLKLRLHHNQFQGEIPTQFGLLSRMDVLDLGSNSFDSTIPTEIGLMRFLTNLDLSNISQLTGPIPSEMARMSSLRDLDLSNSGLTGAIPEEVGDLVLLQDLHFLNVTGNPGLSGEIPKGLCELNANETYCVYRDTCTFEYTCDRLCGCDDGCFCTDVSIARVGGPFDRA